MASTIAFVGSGQMATALAVGATAAGLIPAEELLFCDPSDGQLEAVRKRIPGASTTTDVSFAADCPLVFLSVKPHVLHKQAAAWAKLFDQRHTLVSIAAGIKLARLQEYFPRCDVVRVMPNTPAQVGYGAAALATDLGSDHAGFKRAVAILESVGTVSVVGDGDLDAVTGLSGSGPAFVLLAIEAMIDAGVLNGLSRPVARQLAVQTFLGTAMMLQRGGEHPAAMKDQVTSPGGTTIAGLAELETRGVRAAFMQAVSRATERSRQLSG